MTDIQFTYADPAMPRSKRAIIRMIECMTGQPKLKRLYLDFRQNPVPGEGFFGAAVRQLRLDVQYDAAQLARIPRTGPCVIVANHPYGVLDGVAIAWLTGLVRRDFAILTSAVLLHAPEARPFLLPVDFSGTAAARETNLQTRAAARQRLDEGGCIVVFPAGGVSTSPDRFGASPAVDAPWQPFTVQLIERSGATVVPMFFGGQNSRLFQIASHIHEALRLSLIFKEVRDRIGTALPVVIGDPMPAEELTMRGDRREAADYLMRKTYALARLMPGDRTARRISSRELQPVTLPPPRVCAPRA